MADVKDITAVGRGKWEKQFFSVVSSRNLGTGILTDASPVTYTALEAFIVINNGESRSGASGGKNTLILPDYVKLTAVSMGTAGIDFKIIWVTDTADRWTSGGTSLTTLAANQYVDTYSGFTRVSTSAVIHAGDLVCPAETSAAAVGVSVFRTSVGAVSCKKGDVYVTKFGGFPVSSSQVSMGPVKMVDNVSPVVLGPGSSLVGHAIIHAQSAASAYEVECGWVEVRKDFNA